LLKKELDLKKKELKKYKNLNQTFESDLEKTKEELGKYSKSMIQNS
jgi:hypothetical protein